MEDVLMPSASLHEDFCAGKRQSILESDQWREYMLWSQEKMSLSTKPFLVGYLTVG